MQTNFTLSQLADSDISEAQDILRNCVHCGFCLATCPTYNILGNELDSPRGRIYLIKDMLEHDRPADSSTRFHIDRCLSCSSCMTTCPSGVDYGHLVDTARSHIERSGGRPFSERFWRYLLSVTIPYPSRFRSLLFFARKFSFLSSIFSKFSCLRPLSSMFSLASKSKSASIPLTGIFPSQGEHKGRVALLGGCAQSVLDADINNATVHLLTRLGIEVIVPERKVCCGSLVHHMGLHDASRSHARSQIDLWHDLDSSTPLDAIIQTTSGCGIFIQDYDHVFRDDIEYRDKAIKIKSLSSDISEYLLRLSLPILSASGIKLGYHSACSLRHGQGIVDVPQRLLESAGFEVLEPENSHLCCGSAGVYNILQSEIADELGLRKRVSLSKLGVDAIVSGNLGCLKHLESSSSPPILHFVKLLNWSYGGEKPRELE